MGLNFQNQPGGAILYILNNENELIQANYCLFGYILSPIQ